MRPSQPPTLTRVPSPWSRTSWRYCALLWALRRLVLGDRGCSGGNTDLGACESPSHMAIAATSLILGTPRATCGAAGHAGSPSRAELVGGSLAQIRLSGGTCFKEDGPRLSSTHQLSAASGRLHVGTLSDLGCSVHGDSQPWSLAKPRLASPASETARAASPRLCSVCCAKNVYAESPGVVSHRPTFLEPAAAVTREAALALG